MSVYGAQTPDAPKFQNEAREYDAILVMSFGGPEGMDDVIPFLENVTRGRNIPRERLKEVGQHYALFNGVSPLNAQNRALIDALREELDERGLQLPIYFGNRNWHPMITDTLRQMRDDGVKRALAFFTSAYSSYSGCRQYRENIQEAIETLGEGAPDVDRIRLFYNHPGFINPNVANLRTALLQFDADVRHDVHVAFTAHSIPASMAANCNYERQLNEAARLVADASGVQNYKLVYQSRSGPPQVPWLEPDILDHMDALNAQGIKNIIIHPIGFISDHMEVMYDLDIEAEDKAEEHGMTLVRVPSVGTHPEFVAMIADLIQERMTANPDRPAVGQYGPVHDVCPMNCCLPGTRGRPHPASAQQTAGD